MAALLAILAVMATSLSVGAGYYFAWQSDEARSAAQHQALQVATKHLRDAANGHVGLAPEELSALAQGAGVHGLSLDADLAIEGRDVLSVMDRDGRMVGWLSWEHERPATDLVDKLMPFFGAVALGVLGLSALCLWQARRLRRRPAVIPADPELLRRANEDLLTGAFNKYRLREIFELALASRKPDEIVSCGLVAIDQFSEVNDSVGHSVGDQVLVAISERLRETLPPGSSIGRVAGDCFGIVMVTPDAFRAAQGAEAACRAISRPFRVAPMLQVSASAGLSSAPADGSLREDLVRRAQLALRAAKHRPGSSFKVFTPDMEADLEEKQFIKRELATALTQNALDVHYQPIVAADGSGIVGVEALLRWKHPVRGNIPPADFVHIAEQCGLMNRLGQFVLRRALADSASWPNLYVAVNLSPLQVRDRGFAEVITGLITETRFDPSRLVLEITEGVLIDDPDEMKSRLEELRALGVRLALDDFGSGYSSLGYLRHLPFDKLKIDRSFVIGLAESDNGGVIVQAIVALGRSLGLSVLVEGVETDEQRVLLRLAGCNEMQGFLFARPAPRFEIERMLAMPSRTLGAATG